MSVAVQLPLNNTIQTISRPVAFDILRELRERMRISDKTEIRYYGNDGQAAQFNSTLLTDPTTPNRWPHLENLFVEITETDPPDYLGQISVVQPDNLRFFADYNLGIYMRPVYVVTKLEFKIQYQAKDQNQAERWRNEMRSRIGQGMRILQHQVNYSYGVPDSFVEVLGKLHTLREKIAPYGDTFTEYIQKCMTEHGHIVTNMAGENQVLVVGEKQVRVQGYFDFSGAPDRAEKDDEHGTWVSSITYVAEYMKPIEMVMNYPIVVHQQMLPAKYRPNELPYSYSAAYKKYSQSGQAFENFTGQNQQMKYYGNQGIKIPEFDNYLAQTIQTASVRVFMALAGIRQEDRRLLLNLGQLGSFNLHTDVLEWVAAGEYAYMAREYSSVLQLTHYCDRRVQSQEDLVLNSSLDLSLVADGDLRKTYRVRLGMVVDFDMLPPAALERLKAYPKAAIRICNAINAAIRDKGGVKDIRKNMLRWHDLSKVGLGYDEDGNVVPIDEAVQGYDPERLITIALFESLFVVAKPISSLNK